MGSNGCNFDLNETYNGSSSCSESNTQYPNTTCNSDQSIPVMIDGEGDQEYDHIKRLRALTVEEVMQYTFSSAEEAGYFYNFYGKVIGFSTRKDTLRKHVVNGGVFVKSRRWVCSREGLNNKSVDDRRREPRAISRCNCRASFRIKYNNALEMYSVVEFVMEHNHSLQPKFSHFLRSHRNINISDKAAVTGMHRAGFKTSHIMDYMVEVAGDYSNVGFIMKDLYSHLSRDCYAQMKDSDAECALAYLAGKADNDPLFISRHFVDGEQKLSRLFWCDSTSMTDYKHFGDVLVFDATYKTNLYKCPLVLLIGVNNHFQTVVFGAALIFEETIESYIWLLQHFIGAMNGKLPISVITDGDKATRKAIKNTFPSVKHRLCSWHIGRNYVQNVHVEGFSGKFASLKYKKCSPEVFEQEWKLLIERYGVENVKWINAVYKKREQWAECYLRGYFFAGMRSISRSESINSYFKRYLNSRLRLHEMVVVFDRAVKKLQQTNLEAMNDDFNTSPTLTTSLYHLERHASDVYTRAMFKRFHVELRKEVLMFLCDKVVVNPNHIAYYLSQYTKPMHRWTVIHNPLNETLIVRATGFNQLVYLVGTCCMS